MIYLVAFHREAAEIIKLLLSQLLLSFLLKMACPISLNCVLISCGFMLLCNIDRTTFLKHA